MANPIKLTRMFNHDMAAVTSAYTSIFPSLSFARIIMSTSPLHHNALQLHTEFNIWNYPKYHMVNHSLW